MENNRRSPLNWLVLIIWALIVLAYLVFFGVELWLDHGQLLSPCSGPGCNWASISSAEFAVLESWGVSTSFYANYIISTMIFLGALYLILAVLIIWRRGLTQITFYMSLALVILPIASYADAENVAVNVPALALPSVILSVFGNMVQFLLLYLFPNGKIYPRWAIFPMAFSIIISVVSLLAFGNFIEIENAFFERFDFALFFFVFILAIVFQVFRYLRGSTPVERQQTKWVVFGFVFFLLGPICWYVFYGGDITFAPGQPRLVASVGGWLLVQLSMLTLLSTFVIAILRYRLWNIDLIIRRTLIYGSLTASLVLLYFAAVVILQAAIGRLTGNTQSPIVTVVSTLAIAALFNPLRNRLQDFIDQRFYRQKYDAEQSVSRFAETARDEVDLNRLAGTLLTTVEETMQPDNTSLWIDQ